MNEAQNQIPPVRLLLLCYKQFAQLFVAHNFSVQTSALLPMLPSLLGCFALPSDERFAVTQLPMFRAVSTR